MKQLPPIVKRQNQSGSGLPPFKTYQRHNPGTPEGSCWQNSSQWYLKGMHPLTGGIMVIGQFAKKMLNYRFKKLWEHTLSPFGDIMIVKTGEICIYSRQTTWQTDNVIFSASFQTTPFHQSMAAYKRFCATSVDSIAQSTLKMNVQWKHAKHGYQNCLVSICLLHVQSH